jgi:thiamine-phosphate pyrophosphorylase
MGRTGRGRLSTAPARRLFSAAFPSNSLGQGASAVATTVSTRLYLVVEAPAEPAAVRGLADTLAQLVAHPSARGLVAALLVAPAAGHTLDARIAPLVEAAQKRGVAALVLDDARLARTLKADGVHLAATAAPLAAYEEAREVLGTRFIVGADPGPSRHDAMELGEAGAEYLAFAGPPDHRADSVAWWSEIFEVPCVAFGVASPADAADLARLGADFAAVTLPPGLTAGQAAAWLAPYAEALAPLAATS